VRKEHLVEVGKRVRLKQHRACSAPAGRAGRYDFAF